MVEGTISAGGAPFFHAYKVPEPSVFASFLFREALLEAGVNVASGESARPLVDSQTSNIAQTAPTKKERRADLPPVPPAAGPRTFVHQGGVGG